MSAKKHKAARKLVKSVCGVPEFRPLPAKWFEKIPIIGKYWRIKRIRADICRLQLHHEAAKHASKKVAHKVANSV